MNYSYTDYFAQIYDDVMRQVPYSFWFRYLKDLLKYYKSEPEQVLELAAGTGNMTVNLVKLNKIDRVIALDLSSAMLDKSMENFADKFPYFNKLSAQKNKTKAVVKTAKQRQVELLFLEKNMSKFKLANKVDLIVSFFDSLNYLTEKDQLAACFTSAADSLSRDGLFIFDMNSLARIRTIGNRSIVLEGEDYTCFWQDIVYPENNLWQVKLKICPDHQDIPCFEELHTERGYKINTITSLLKKSGFSAVDIYQAFSFREGRDSSDRLYFVAALNKKRLTETQTQFKKYYYLIKNFCDYSYLNLKYSL